MKIFETASFHIVKPCNMKCKFCYATFEDMKVVKQLPKNEAFIILDKLKEAGLQKITFAGGEPLLYKWIYDVIEYSKSIGLVTSIITNGSLLTDELLEMFKWKLDWVGISIDSLSELTNELIGRTNKEKINYYDLCFKIKDAGFKLKINTVINSFNWYSYLGDFIDEVQPERWKVFQALRVEGQNDKEFNEIKVTDEQYKSFIDQHKLKEDMTKRDCLVPEDNEAMTGSYLLIDPLGRLFENSSGKHNYSCKLQDNDIDLCLSEINLNREMFEQRGGIYNW